MPDERRHRGAHPEDAALFAPRWHEPLRHAVAELSWLLTRGYASPSALKVVGDRHNLDVRQRIAVMRSACPDDPASSRRARELAPGDVAGRAVLIDGYNVLTTIEAALAGGVVLVGRDNAWRDMASMHGTWRRVEETLPALHLAGAALEELGTKEALWLLDQPVSNSGRLKLAILQAAADRGWPWRVEVVMDPDKVLGQSADGVVITSDSVILDRCGPWLGLARHVVSRLPSAWVIDLS